MSAPPPTSALFYSTNREGSWGAPDYVWPIAAERLLARGIKVAGVIHPDALGRSEIRALEAAGVRFVAQPERILGGGQLGKLRKRLADLRPRGRRFQRLLNSLERPHVFINQAGTLDVMYEPGMPAYLENTAGGFTLLCHSNQPNPPMEATRREQTVRLFSQARRCLFASDWMRKLAETQLLHHFDNAGTFPQLVRFESIAPLPWPKADPITPIKLAAVSRLDCFHKGIDVMLHALARLGPQLPAWTMDIYGRGSDKAYLESLTAWLGLADKVFFRDYERDIPTIWASHHLLLLTSRFEGLGVSMLEAMACGRPILRTPYGGAKEWVVDGETGYLCPAPEPDLIAATLTRAINDRARWPAMGEAAFHHFKTHQVSDPAAFFLEPFTAE